MKVKVKRQHKQQQNQGSKSRRPPGPGSWPWDKRRAAPSCAYRWSRHGRGRGGRGNRKPRASVRVRVLPFLSFPFLSRAALCCLLRALFGYLRFAAPSPLKPLSSSFLFFSWFSILLVVDVECSGPKGGAGFRKTNETKRQKKIRKYKDTRIRPLLCKFGHPTPHTSPAAPAPARMSLVLVRLTLVFAFAL